MINIRITTVLVLHMKNSFSPTQMAGAFLRKYEIQNNLKARLCLIIDITQRNNWDNGQSDIFS